MRRKQSSGQERPGNSKTHYFCLVLRFRTHCMQILKWLLFPFALLYGGIMVLRNYGYDLGIFRAGKFNIPVISVGNLTVGGTGKTPHVEFLLRLLATLNLATLSRGYKRKTKGFLLAGPGASAETLGDEPYQYHLDFPEVTVAVCEKRVAGIQQIMALQPATQAIILDDAFQHRAVTPTLNLLISDYYRRFDQDFMLPTGLLREPRSGARRADAVIISKCPENLSRTEQQALKASLSKYTRPGTPVFFTTYKYGKTLGFGAAKVPGKNILLVTAIANPAPLAQYLKQAGYTVLEQLAFPDHHAFTDQDLAQIKAVWQQYRGQEAAIFTTRKDAVKLIAPAFRETVAQLPFFYVPIEVAFLADQPAFEALVRQAATVSVP